MITPETLQAIDLDIVMRWPFDPCTQIDTFVLMDDPEKINQTNFGMNYQNYLDGDFYSRKWVNGGANPNSLCGGFPMVAHQSFNVGLPDTGESQPYIQRGSILIIDVADCEDCGECRRTQWQVSKDTKRLLMQFMLIRMQYLQYMVTPTTGDDYVEWAHPAVMAHQISEGEISDAVVMADLEGSIRWTSDLTEWPYNPAKKTIGWFVNYELDYCFTNDIVPNVALPNAAQVGALRCESC